MSRRRNVDKFYSVLKAQQRIRKRENGDTGEPILTRRHPQPLVLYWLRSSFLPGARNPPPPSPLAPAAVAGALRLVIAERTASSSTCRSPAPTYATASLNAAADDRAACNKACPMVALRVGRPSCIAEAYKGRRSPRSAAWLACGASCVRRLGDGDNKSERT